MGSTQVIDYLLLLPLIIVFGGAVAGVLVEAVVARTVRFMTQFVLAFIVLVGALGATIVMWRRDDLGNEGVGSLMLDGPTWVVWTLVLFFALLASVLFADRRVGGGDSTFAAMGASMPGSQAERDAALAHQEHTEVFPLMLFSVLGMMIFPAANDLIMLFVGLEVLSLPLYLLTGLARRRRLVSQEAALKYFLLGALSSAIFVYGLALTYGYTGAFGFRNIDTAISTSRGEFLLIMAGMALMTIGVLFKVGAAPFHSWVPDVYTGAPSPVTAFMAICTKLAAFGGLLRLLYVPFGSLRLNWQIVLIVVAVLTMTFGAVVGIAQRDVKRMLAYSSVAHAGFLLLGVVGAITTSTGAGRGDLGSVGSVYYYLIAYGLATVGAFAVVTQVRRAGGEATAMTAWAGLGRSNPLLAAMMTVFLLSMTGIPLTAGFLGKVFAFTQAWQGGFEWLVLVAVLFSAVTAAFYLRLVWVMFFNEPNETTEVATPSFGVMLVMALCVIGTIVLGLFPSPITDLLANNTVFLR